MGKFDDKKEKSPRRKFSRENDDLPKMTIKNDSENISSPPNGTQLSGLYHPITWTHELGKLKGTLGVGEAVMLFRGWEKAAKELYEEQILVEKERKLKDKIKQEEKRLKEEEKRIKEKMIRDEEKRKYEEKRRKEEKDREYIRDPEDMELPLYFGKTRHKKKSKIQDKAE